MANEIKITNTFEFLTGFNSQIGPWKRKESFFANFPNDSFVHAVQNVGTSEEELAQVVDLGTPGWCFVKNLDTTNYIELAGVTGQYMVRLNASESCVFRLTSASLFAIANTANCVVEYIILEN